MVFSSICASAKCEISEELINKNCSPEYFAARSLKQLNEYLRYGKFENGRLLNLEIAFDLKDKEINIGTNCDLKLNYGVDLYAGQNGICLKAKNIFINKGSELYADKKAPINISANDSIKIRRTSVKTQGIINISTTQFNPFENEILISRDSQISAEKLNITTPSTLIINEDSRIKSSYIILNGGNCEIGNNDDQDNDHTRDLARQCKKFKPKLSYSGTCATNPLSDLLEITSSPNASNPQILKFQIKNSPTDAVVKWRFDNTIQASEAAISNEFPYAGKHVVEAVVMNRHGHYKIISEIVNVSPSDSTVGQLKFFQFPISNEAPNKVEAFINMKKLVLTKSQEDSDLYFTVFNESQVGTGTLFVPYFGYKTSIKIKKLAVISNPDEFINNQFNILNDNLDSFSTDLDFGFAVTSLKTLLSEAKNRYLSMSAAEKQNLAQLVQANISSQLNQKVTTQNKKIFDLKKSILNLLIPTANAIGFSMPPDTTLQDTITVRYMLRYTSYAIIGIWSGVNVLNSGIAFFEFNPVYGVLSIIAGFEIIRQTLQTEKALLRRIFSFTKNWLPQLSPISSVLGGEINYVQMQGTFGSILTGTNSSQIQLVVDKINNTNSLLVKANSYIASANKILLSLSFKTQIPKPFKEITPPSEKINSYLSTDYISATLVNSEFGDATLETIRKDGVNLEIQLKAPRSEYATVRFRYNNSFLGVNNYIDQKILISVTPNAVIKYTKNNLVVNFDSTDSKNPGVSGLIYDWDFGDGETLSTASKTFSHRYTKAGNYTVELKVSDQLGATSTTTTEIVVDAGIVKIKIDPTQTFFQMVTNPYNDIYRPAPAIPIPLDSSGLGMLEMGAFNTSDSCFPCLQTSMVVVFSDGVNYLSPGSNSLNISNEFYHPDPSLYIIPAQAFQISTDPNYPSYVEIPAGAKYIFVSPADGYFRDNSDYSYYLYLNSGGF